MLKKVNRLKSNVAFSATYKQHNSIADKFLILYIGRSKNETEQDNPTRVGFVVSKKISKRAVKRNKIKRLLRENLRLVIKNNSYPNINNYLSLVFMAREKALEGTNDEISQSIYNLLSQIN